MGYLDNTGTYVKIGTEVAVPLTGGEYKTYGELREIELTLNLTPTTVLTTASIINDQIFWPKGVIVQEVETYAVTAATGATAVLNVGLIGTDRTTSIDPQAFLKAAPLANMSTAGTKTIYTQPTTGAGNYVLNATVSPTVGYITADWDTAAFTAGQIKIRIRYFRP